MLLQLLRALQRRCLLGLVLPKLKQGLKIALAALLGLLLLLLTYAEFIAMLGTYCIRNTGSAILYQDMASKCAPLHVKY